VTLAKKKIKHNTPLTMWEKQLERSFLISRLAFLVVSGTVLVGLVWTVWPKSLWQLSSDDASYLRDDFHLFVLNFAARVRTCFCWLDGQIAAVPVLANALDSWLSPLR
jgi:hypothetical protein